MPSTRLIMPCGSWSAINNINTAANTAKGTSTQVVVLFMFRGTKMAVIPRIANILKMLLPNILPSANAELPFIDDTVLTTNSGVEVPNATTVRPMTMADIFSLCARAAPPSTSILAP